MLKCEDDYTNDEGAESPLNILKILAVCAHRVIRLFSYLSKSSSIHFIYPTILVWFDHNIMGAF